MCPQTLIWNFFIFCSNASVEIVEEERGKNNHEVVNSTERDVTEYVFSLKQWNWEV